MRRLFSYLALGSVLAIAACSDSEEKQQAPLTAPEMTVVQPPYPGCDFGNLKNLVNSYFTSPYQLTAQQHESLMESTDALQRRDHGFAIMDLIGRVSRGATPPSATIGSNLTKALTKCMFDTTQPVYTSLAGGGGIDAVRFDFALTPGTGGVYYVVGAGYDTPTVPNLLKGSVGATYNIDSSHVDPNSEDSRYSAVAPGVPNDLTTYGTSWAAVLAGNSFENNRALIYGYRFSATPLVYEWATIDPSTTVTPYALVSVCDGNDASQVKNLLLHESGVGVVTYSPVNLCGVPDVTGVSGFKSHFQSTTVSAIDVTWLQTSKSPLKVGTQYTFIASATSQVTVNGVTSTEGVNNACLTVSGTNNNGTGTALVPDVTMTPCTTQQPPNNLVSTTTKTGIDPLHPNNPPRAGIATFKFSISKSGGIILTLAGKEVVGREGITFVNPAPLKYLVNPR